MKIKRFSSPPYMTNTYCLYAEKEAILVDPTGSADAIETWTRENGIQVLAAVFTHSHGDHFPTPTERWFFEFPWYAHASALEGFKSPEINLSESIYGQAIAYADIQTIEPEDRLCIGPFDLKVLKTPGHTAGSVCYSIGNVLFSGDTLFRESVGRTDLPTGSMQVLRKSLAVLMTELPDETIVFPGHGERTTIGYERKVNPFIER